MTLSKSSTISIAMCTYNGERFLSEQLASILLQSCPPYELVVCDDKSKDNTLLILEKFAALAPFSVRIYKNEINLGYKKNFEKAAGLCRGDIIVFADQDDVWLQNKLSKIKSTFEEKPEIGFTFSDSIIVDDYLNPRGYSFFDTIHFDKHIQKKFHHDYALKLLFKENIIFFGMLLAFRANYRRYVFPLPDFWSHDGWLPIILSGISDFSVISEPLVLYRQHSQQFVGKRPSSLKVMMNKAKITGKKQYIDTLNRWKAALAFVQSEPQLANSKLSFMINEKIINLIARSELSESLTKRLSHVIRETITLRYFNYANGWKSILKDIIIR